MALMACALAFIGASTALADAPPSSQSAERLNPVVGHAMGGDDTVNIYCNDNNVEEWSHALFWAPGEGADVLNFQDWEFNYQAYPWVFILDGEAEDQIQFNGMNIAANSWGVAAH